MGILGKFNFGLKKTRDKMSKDMVQMLDSFDSFDEDLYSELEEILVLGDVGVNTALDITNELRERVRREKIKNPAEVREEVKEIVAEMLDGGEDMGLVTVPSIILVIGVNGAGKTTTIGKMASMYKSQGKKVILGAADTFRAAAIDQLDVWAQRAGVDIIKHKEGADPSAVIFDTIAAGKARDCDIIICDTAGRLHNKKHLMEELAKMYKVIDRELPYSDREVLLVLDSTTGQNAVNQAREFMNAAEITGIVLTKLDSTARGGIVLSIKNELKIPVKFIGVGEKLDDLQPFNPKLFAEGLFFSIEGSENEEDDDYYEKLKQDSVFEGEAEEKLDSEALGDIFQSVLQMVEMADEEDEARDEYQDESPDDSEDESETLFEEEDTSEPPRADETGVFEHQPQPQGRELLELENTAETPAVIEDEPEQSAAEYDEYPAADDYSEAETDEADKSALIDELLDEEEDIPSEEAAPKKKKGFFGGLFGKK